MKTGLRLICFRKADLRPIVGNTRMKGGTMAALQEAVVKKFLQILESDATFDQSKTATLEALLKAGGKIKPEDLAAIFALPEGGEAL
ncbi:hypothetical protein KUV73_00980 [Mameliella alba]|nr:hypothetical protein [Mameliella alba]MBY6167887.1 hypothetical protein [Mameliella alba]MBY6172908.1 hypothetical protein [Mameliella alba]